MSFYTYLPIEPKPACVYHTPMLEQNTIHTGDCIQLLGGCEEPFADLIFADPPFNIGYTYDTYRDSKGYDEYLDWSRQWIQACVDVLKPQGSMYIAIGDDFAAELRMVVRDIQRATGQMVLRNWIVWRYTFGQQTKAKFARSHTHIFYFVKDPKHFTFNDRDIRVPSARQTTYADKRANPLGKVPDDTWLYSRVCGTFKERMGWHGCQMPEKLLARIVKASSNPGDIVLDPFSGSGTTAATAAVLGRSYIGIELSSDYAAQSRERIATILDSGIDDIDEREPQPVPPKSTRANPSTRKKINKHTKNNELFDTKDSDTPLRNSKRLTG